MEIVGRVEQERKASMTVAINQIERYYDTYEVEGEEMGQSDVHIRNIH